MALYALAAASLIAAESGRTLWQCATTWCCLSWAATGHGRVPWPTTGIASRTPHRPYRQSCALGQICLAERGVLRVLSRAWWWFLPASHWPVCETPWHRGARTQTWRLELGCQQRSGPWWWLGAPMSMRCCCHGVLGSRQTLQTASPTNQSCRWGARRYQSQINRLQRFWLSASWWACGPRPHRPPVRPRRHRRIQTQCPNRCHSPVLCRPACRRQWWPTRARRDARFSTAASTTGWWREALYLPRRWGRLRQTPRSACPQRHVPVS